MKLLLVKRNRKNCTFCYVILTNKKHLLKRIDVLFYIFNVTFTSLIIFFRNDFALILSYVKNSQNYPLLFLWLPTKNHEWSGFKQNKTNSKSTLNLVYQIHIRFSPKRLILGLLLLCKRKEINFILDNDSFSICLIMLLKSFYMLVGQSKLFLLELDLIKNLLIKLVFS